MQEKRRHPRHPLHPTAAFEDASGARFEAVCGDVSLGGAYLETPSPAPFGARVVVLLRLPGLEGESRIEATVRWTKPTGMGVQFGVMGARETHALIQALATTG